MRVFKLLFFVFIGFALLFYSMKDYKIYKKEKKTFLDNAPGLPNWFDSMLFGVFFIILGISLYMHHNE